MNTREIIIQAAAELFETNGYLGTTTLNIAKKAQVSEITIFRYFKTKENLFNEVVASITIPDNLALIPIHLTGRIQEDLPVIAERLLKYFCKENRMIRMMLFESLTQPKLLETLRKAPAENILFLKNYLQNQMEQGILNNNDAEKVAELFISTLFGYALGMESLKNENFSEASIKKYAALASTTLLSGLLANEKG